MACRELGYDVSNPNMYQSLLQVPALPRSHYGFVPVLKADLNCTGEEVDLVALRCYSSLAANPTKSKILSSGTVTSSPNRVTPPTTQFGGFWLDFGGVWWSLVDFGWSSVELGGFRWSSVEFGGVKLHFGGVKLHFGGVKLHRTPTEVHRTPPKSNQNPPNWVVRGVTLFGELVIVPDESILDLVGFAAKEK